MVYILSVAAFLLCISTVYYYVQYQKAKNIKRIFKNRYTVIEEENKALLDEKEMLDLELEFLKDVYRNKLLKATSLTHSIAV